MKLSLDELIRTGGRLAFAGMLAGLAFPARAGEIAPGRSATPVPVATNPAVVAAQAQRRQQVSETIARTKQALDSMQAAQAAARALAASGPDNLGINPNQPGVQLPNVPNGLLPGGLVPDSGLAQSGIANAVTTWQNARTPVQTAAGGTTQVTVEQTAAQALLNWQSFNIGKGTILNFDQSAGGANRGQWVAFNRIADPTGVPSQILGSIKADGQVYVINQNGIIFGGTSQVNTHALVASSLPINENLINRGLLNNPDRQFLFSQLAIPAVAQGSMPAFNAPAAPSTPNGRNGDVIVQPGARLESPTTADKVGGRIALVGPNVLNQGTISTPDGQTILAAGNQVGFLGHDGSDPSLRGLDVYVGAVDANSGTAVNSGLIDAPRANTTIAGKNVQQNGVISSSTSVSLNGRVDLLANYNAVPRIQGAAYNGLVYNGSSSFIPTSSGVVSLGENSLISVLPELSSSETVVGTELALRSRINLQGKAVHLKARSEMVAPNAVVDLKAGAWLGLGPSYSFTFASGQVFFDSGARIDVSGSIDVSVPVSQNIISLELRGAELADFPLQRNGVFRGQTVSIDIRAAGLYDGRAWVGTPLADTAGYAGLVQRGIGQLTTEGGSVNIKAGESVVMQPGSEIDVSGGWTNFESGIIKTSKVAYRGHMVDISSATPDRIYQGLDYESFTDHSKWGVTESWGTSLMSRGTYQEAYAHGADAGSISVSAPAMALDGKLLGKALAGPRQGESEALPEAGSLALFFVANNPVNESYLPYSPTPPKITFSPSPSASPSNPFEIDGAGNPVALREDRRTEVVLSSALLGENSFGNLLIENSDGEIVVPAGVSLKTSPSGSIAFKAKNIDIQGALVSPGGLLDLTIYDFSPYTLAQLKLVAGSATPAEDPSRGRFTLGPGGLLDTAGTVADRRRDSFGSSLPNGGKISIAGYNLNLASGSSLDVSGGVSINAAGKISYGDAGSIVLRAGQDPGISSLLRGKLILGSELKGYAGKGAKAGALEILAPLVQIGGSQLLNGDSNGSTFWINRTDGAGNIQGPDFFSQGGFGSFSVSGIGSAAGPGGAYQPALVIAPDARIAPVTSSWILQKALSGGEAGLAATLLPQAQRGPANLSFGAVGAIDDFSGLLTVRGDLVMHEGASIRTDPHAKASVTLKGGTVAVLGTVFAPGGQIAIMGGSKYASLDPDPAFALPTVHVGKNAVLSAAGAPVLTVDARGFRTGGVLGGGGITVSGNIVAEEGAVLDVRGSSAVLDVLSNYTDKISSELPRVSQMAAVRIDSDGGSITLKGSQELFSRATLLGGGGGPKALGGSLVVSSGRFYRDADIADPRDANLVVVQNASAMLLSDRPSGDLGIGKVVRDASGNAILGRGYFEADRFMASGLESLTLGGVVHFTGSEPVSISAGRSITLGSRGDIGPGSGGVLLADTTVNLFAPYIAIGLPFRGPLLPQNNLTPFVKEDAAGSVGPFRFSPTYGSGVLNIEADSLVDIGILSLQNIGWLNITVRNGDIRGDGVLDAAGSVVMTAGQIYPTTGTRFTVAAYDYLAGGVTNRGSVTIGSSGAGAGSLPFSAGGDLNIYASVINQGGVLRAPLGGITLGWNGDATPPQDLIAGTAFNPAQEVRLLAGSVTSVSAIDPVSGQPLIIPYGTVLNGVSWMDPSGVDITTTGLPEKSVSIAGAKVEQQAGAVVDIRGGGDLYAYQWVKGLGGTQDVLSSVSSFAVIPGYQAKFAPVDPGYRNGGLSAGDQVYLEAGSGLSAGTYTLLPARYALLPGAFLLTPQEGVPVRSVAKPDGSSLVSGYRFRDLEQSQANRPLSSAFEVAPSSVVRARAEYKDSLANSYLKGSALANGNLAARFPIDAGKLALSASDTMVLKGSVQSQSVAGGRGSQIDISSTSDILIAGPGAANQTGVLVLDASVLSSFGAESLLVGGLRESGPSGTKVRVATNRLTVDNAGTPLSGPEVILVANSNLTLAENSVISQSGSFSAAPETLLLGDAAQAGSGNGLLLRVGGETAGQIVRSGVSASAAPLMTVAAGASVFGDSVMLDSTSATSLDLAAVLRGKSISLGSGQIVIELTDPGALPATTGLVLSSNALQNLQNSTGSLSLLSYSSIDIYGTGSLGTRNGAGQFAFANLELHAGEIRGFNQGSGTVELNAGNILLDNSPGRAGPGVQAGMSGSLVLNADTIRLGGSTLQVDQYASVELNAARSIVTQGQGKFSTAGSLKVTTPALAGAAQADHALVAAGALEIMSGSGSASPGAAGGLGAKLRLEGSAVDIGSDIYLPSGMLEIRALSGDVRISGRLDVSGTAQEFYDLTQYTSGGTISLKADSGSVYLLNGSAVTVAARPEAGHAGTLSIQTPNGNIALDGSIFGQGGAGGKNGTFLLDVEGMPSLAALNAKLNAASFTESREVRVRAGDVLVDGSATARHFLVSADQGSINVTGTVDASGERGGSIGLMASGSVVLQSGSVLSVAADSYDAAGKGGEITLEAGSQINGAFNNVALGTGPQVDIQAGSTMDLSVAETASLGEFSGSLHIRARQSSGNNDLQVRQINGNLIGASKIVVEGYQVYTPAGGAVNSVTAAIQANGNLFGGNSNAIADRLFVGNASLKSLAVIAPGAEIINTTGDLTLASDWNLAGFRFGPETAPGILTMRASGNLVFNGALSDGFSGGASLWLAPLMTQNALLPVNAQSWSYRLTSGADFSAADYHAVRDLGQLAANSGSVLVGKNAGAANGAGGATTLTSAVINGFYQVIRTGTGDIDISAGRDVQLLNQFATIYTAGVAVNDPTTLFAPGDFVMPVLTRAPHPSQGPLGSVQQTYAAQYSLGGGNVTIEAQQDIAHYTRDGFNNLIDDSSRQMPTNWLYRRGYVDPVTGLFGSSGTTGPSSINDPMASTTWWVDFSNFFEGVGALGGGNVTLGAGRDVKNVDAVIPTNARMPGGAPDASRLVELGGGDLLVRSGRNVDGGVYYVERGHGELAAGNQITTNKTRSPTMGLLRTLNNPEIGDSQTWLPTTLFVGKSQFDVTANGDILLGPVSNPFLLPQGLNNKFWYKTYFNTYGEDSGVHVASLGGDVTLRNGVVLSGTSSPVSMLQAWYSEQLFFSATNTNTASYFQPWLRLAESELAAFSTAFTIAPPQISVAALSGDINLVGNLNLFPSPVGGVELVAQGALNGLQSAGLSNTLVFGQSTRAWISGRINLSDADPSFIPGISKPFAYQEVVGRAGANTSQNSFLDFIGTIFNESGSTSGTFGVMQTKQALHASELLHAGDTEPVRLYAVNGDISGLTLFSGKSAQVIAGNDISDVALYLQNVRVDDTTLVAAGRDITAFDPGSSLRTLALASGNGLATGESILAGDIQIGGPGYLEVLAGRNLDLGVGANNPDGTALGITSIGNARNPALPFEGAGIVVGAGLGQSVGLSRSRMDFAAFERSFLNPAGDFAARYLPELGKLMNLSSAGNAQVWEAFAVLPEEEQARLALNIFYQVLRDTGRDYNDSNSPDYKSYAMGFAAVDALFPGTWGGNISLTSRQIKTKNGGDISMFAPGGMLTVGFDIAGNQAADQGILTEYGGNISIFTRDDVVVGTSRIFTLRGGDVAIWSSRGDIAAGASSKTVQAAPPTRVLIDPQSADVQTDLAGLATGGGIGVLTSVAGIPPGNVDLIAPVGTVDAGDAGIRSAGNLNIAAQVVLNASNIQTGGSNVGGTVAAPAAPNVAGLTTASNASGAATNTANEMTQQAQNQNEPKEEMPSIVTVEVLGYGGDEEDEG